MRNDLIEKLLIIAFMFICFTAMSVYFTVSFKEDLMLARHLESAMLDRMKLDDTALSMVEEERSVRNALFEHFQKEVNELKDAVDAGTIVILHKLNEKEDRHEMGGDHPGDRDCDGGTVLHEGEASPG